jgi:hypothetical protein
LAEATSIFKYRDFGKSSLELLINKEIWFAKPDSLNDPFECQMLFPEVLESIWRHHPIDKAEKIKIENYLTDQLETIGICSFSRVRQNQLMWAHYADEHKGFCIGFDEDTLKQTSAKFHSQVVKYQDELPYEGVIERIKLFENSPGANSAHSISGDILSSVTGIKYTNWEYEREIRLMKPNFGAMSFSESAVVSIAFGLRMPERDKQTLRKLLSGAEWAHVLWFQAEKLPDKFGLHFKKI